MSGVTDSTGNHTCHLRVIDNSEHGGRPLNAPSAVLYTVVACGAGELGA